MPVTLSGTTTEALEVEVLTRKTKQHMITITVTSLTVAYGAVAGLIGLTIGEYSKKAAPSYMQKIEYAYKNRASYNGIVL